MASEATNRLQIYPTPTEKRFRLGQTTHVEPYPIPDLKGDMADEMTVELSSDVDERLLDVAALRSELAVCQLPGDEQIVELLDAEEELLKAHRYTSLDDSQRVSQVYPDYSHLIMRVTDKVHELYGEDCVLPGIDRAEDLEELTVEQAVVLLVSSREGIMEQQQQLPAAA